MESQGLQTYSSFLHENRKELTILLLLGALAGAAYYLFSFSEPPENIPFELTTGILTYMFLPQEFIIIACLNI